MFYHTELLSLYWNWEITLGVYFGHLIIKMSVFSNDLKNWPFSSRPLYELSLLGSPIDFDTKKVLVI